MPYLSKPSSGEWTKPHKNAYHQLLFWETACSSLFIYSRFGQETIIGYGWHLMLNSLKGSMLLWRAIMHGRLKLALLYTVIFQKKIYMVMMSFSLIKLAHEPISLSGEVHPFLYGLFAFFLSMEDIYDASVGCVPLQAALLLRL